MDLSIRGYLAGEVSSGSTLRNSAVSGGDERRERVYNTMFHVPWRAELVRGTSRLPFRKQYEDAASFWMFRRVSGFDDCLFGYRL
jgi:hypothetical protein